MPQTITGNPATSHGNPIQLTAVADGDAANATNLANTPLQAVTDVIAWLQAHAALFDASNTFSAAQTIAALLTLSTSDLALTKSGDQAVTKSGSGKLQLGTSIAADLELVRNAVVMLALTASGIDAKTQKIVNVVDPDAAQDAATMGYVDTLASGPTAPTPNSGYTAIDGLAYWRTRDGMVHLKGGFTFTGGGDVAFTLPVGFRPAYARAFAVSSGSATLRTILVSAAGEVGYVPMPSGTTYLDTVSFLAE
jgi:hypothetical protein